MMRQPIKMGCLVLLLLRLARAAATNTSNVSACDRTVDSSPYVVLLKFHKVGGEATSEIVKKHCAIPTLAPDVAKRLVPHNWYFMNNNAFTHQTISVYRREGLAGLGTRLPASAAPRALLVALLRDPVEQHLSALYFWSDHHDWTPAQRASLAHPRNWTVADFDGLVAGLAPRKFGGHEALLTLARHRPDLDAREAPLPFDDGDDEAVAEAAAAAKANLRRDVAVVGTLDRDAAFLRLLALAAGWPTTSVCTHLLAHGAGRIYHKYLGRNRRPPAAELLGPELLAHVRHRLRGDLDLHAFAGQLLEDRLRAFGEDADAADATWRGACCTGREKSDSTSLQRECSARARSGKSIHASRALREMIARPKMSRNERKTTEI